MNKSNSKRKVNSAVGTSNYDLLTRVTKLAADIEKCPVLGTEAVMKFVGDLDFRTENEWPGVLADRDYAMLLLDSLERRGKVPIAPILFGVWIDMWKRERRNSRTNLKTNRNRTSG